MALLNGCWLTSPLTTLTILEGSLVSIGISGGRTKGLLRLVGFKRYLGSFQMRRLSLVSAGTHTTGMLPNWRDPSYLLPHTDSTAKNQKRSLCSKKLLHFFGGQEVV